jgi:hypothetical protein
MVHKSKTTTQLWEVVREVREKVEGQQFTRWVENTNMADCISTINSIEHQ